MIHGLIGNVIGLVKNTCNLIQFADTTFLKGEFGTVHLGGFYLLCGVEQSTLAMISDKATFGVFQSTPCCNKNELFIIGHFLYHQSVRTEV